MEKRRGKIVVITGPSGVGKGTVCQRMLARFPELSLSVSMTSRAMRPHEQDGVDYFFVTVAGFQQAIETKQLLEWAEYNGNFYGTPQAPIEASLAQGHHVLLEIETQGAQAVKQIFPEACLIFLQPPSLEALKSRLETRGSNTDQDIINRLQIAQAEIQRSSLFDHCILNDDLDRCCQQVEAVLKPLLQPVKVSP